MHCIFKRQQPGVTSRGQLGDKINVTELNLTHKFREAKEDSGLRNNPQTNQNISEPNAISCIRLRIVAILNAHYLDFLVLSDTLQARAQVTESFEDH
jgi:hypothetical protein